MIRVDQTEEYRVTRPHRPFGSIPHLKLAGRLAIPAAVAALFGFLFMGVLATTLSPSVSLPPFEMAKSQYSSLNFELSHSPEACWNLDDDTKAQKKKICDDYWEQVKLHALFAAIPPGFVLVVLFLLFDSLHLFYKRANKKAEKKSEQIGVVTDPALAAPDLYSRFFCFKKISVQLPDRTQFRVYVPETVPTPLPGSRMQIYSAGRHWGAARIIGVPYSPHLAVISAL